MSDRSTKGNAVRAVLIGAGSGLSRARAQLGLLEAESPVVVDQVDIEGCRADDGRLDASVLHTRVWEAVRDASANATIASLPCAMTSVLADLGATASRLGIAFRVMPTLTDVMLGNTAHAWNGDAASGIDLGALIGRAPRAVDERLVRTAVAGKRVLITGAGGSIGSELARLCARFEPASLILMDRSENALFEIDRRIATAHPELARTALLHDVVDAPATLQRITALRPQMVFHAAAHKHVPLMEDHPAAAVRNNLFGTKSVADAALAAGASRFVMISTDKAVNPTSVMGATKRMAELYVRSLNGRGTTRFSLVRFGNVLGSACSVLPIWAAQIADGGPVTVTHPEMTRYFMTIPEAAALVVQAAAIEGEGPEVLVLDMGEPVRILELAERFVRLAGFEPVMEGSGAGAHARPTMPIVFTGIRPGEKLSEELAHEAEELRPTPVPGVLAWGGEAPSRARVDSMVEDLSSIETTRAAEEVIGAIDRHVRRLARSTPEQEIEIVSTGPGMRVGSHAA